MMSSKSAYLSPNREFNNSSLRPANMESLQKSSQRREPQRTEPQTQRMETILVLEEIVRDKDLLSDLYPVHRTAVQSIQQTEEGLHILFILHCVHMLQCIGKTVTVRNLLDKCLDLAQRLPTKFFQDLFQMFPSIEVELASHAAAMSSGVSPVDTASATNVAATPLNEEASVSPVNPPPLPPRSRAPAQDFVDGLVDMRGGGLTSTNASSSIEQDETDKVSFLTRSAAPVEPAINSSAKPDDENLLGATASPLDVASFRMPEQKEESQRKSGDSRAERARHVKESLWAVQHENKILETYKQCIQCKKNPRDITFLPCGHFITCRQCAGPIFTCMLCNRAILATIDTYLS